MREIKTEIINTTKQVGDLVDWLILRHSPPEPYELTMYIDLEGVNLCREGSLSILTLLIDTGIPTIRVSFNTTGIKGKTLKDILHNEKIPKVFFDVRNDSDALFTYFSIALQGVEDVQLIESATRTTTSSRKYLNGLAKCIEQSVLYGNDLTSWKLAKEKGGRLFRWKTNRWRDLVNEETKKRVEATLAPWSEDQNRTLDKWNYVPPPCDNFDDDDWDSDEDDGWVDDGPTSCSLLVTCNT
ncbi:hypothetical protein BKA61DRAFT_643391 [Leptodontidium sp. MPI-SDFR-AT-0119]|nr:hypothetical protein BKA61DRAFT_643391 [Leptodontidium sp. MPI-SDFR-AT-0119]